MPIKKQQLETAIANAETLQGTYLMFAGATQDQQAQAAYKAMERDVAGHLQQLHQALHQLTYSQWVKQMEPKPPRVRNALLAFAGGGLVCLIGELVTDMWEAVLGISHKEAADPAVATLIFAAALLTGLGWFDKGARFLGAGLAVPVTGFSNALTSSALEFKREGPILGIGGRIFQLAAPVIVYGVVTAFAVGLVTAFVRALR
jgi:stage V sporulation protein AC